MKHLVLSAAVIAAICFAVSHGGLIRRMADDVGVNATAVEFVEWSHTPEWFECYNNKHENCIAPNLDQYEPFFESPQMAAMFINDRSNLEELANATQAAKICIEEEYKKPHCEGQNIDNEVAFVADYLASSDNLDVLVNVSSSACLSNPLLAQYASQGLYTCVTELYSDLQSPEDDPCEAVEALKECLILESAAWCGPEAGVFVASMWDHFVHTDAGQSILMENSPLPSTVISGCYQKASAVKRFTRALLKKISD